MIFNSHIDRYIEGEKEKIEMKTEIAKLKQRIDALMLENNQLKTNKRQKFDM